jgi:chloramphenicol-sensitive protein RarD
MKEDVGVKFEPDEQLLGILYGAGAFILWGVFPIYWKLVVQVPALQIMSHRVAWCFVFMALVLLVTKKLGSFLSELREIFSSIKKFFSIFLASVLISVNWLTYIWAVNHDHIIETSLGYYINPLVSVLLGVIVLKEKLSLWQTVSFVLAAIGVLNMTLHFGSFPWIALVLAMSFGFYGLCKKIIHLGAVTGIAVETMFISPFALLYLYYAHSSGVGAFALNNPGVSLVLAGAGVVTAIPLILFAGGTKRLPLSIIGFLQSASADTVCISIIHRSHNRVVFIDLVPRPPSVVLSACPAQGETISGHVSSVKSAVLPGGRDCTRKCFCCRQWANIDE